MGREDESFFSGEVACMNIPSWYELSWSGDDLAIILRIHREFIKNSPSLSEKTPMVKALAEDLKLNSFNGDFCGDFGYGACFKNCGENGNFNEFSLSLPKIRIASEKRCGMCGGKGKDKFLGDTCFSCGGSGKGSDIILDTAFQASATLTVLTTYLQSGDIKTSSQNPQLLTLDTITRQGPHGGSIGGEISLQLRHWLISHAGHNTIPEAIQAMKNAYNHMYGLRGLDDHRFRTFIWENGGLCMDCPGDACGVHPDNYMRDKGGYEFSCHNVDSPLQQLTLIAGLAALTDQARREIVYSE